MQTPNEATPEAAGISIPAPTASRDSLNKTSAVSSHTLTDALDKANASAQNLPKVPRWVTEYYSRIKLDAFHLLQRYQKRLGSSIDPVARLCSIMLRDALIVTNPEDEEALENFLMYRGMPKEQVKKLGRTYFNRRSRRVIPPPELLAARLQIVVDLFRGRKMANGKPVFKGREGQQSSFEEEHREILRHVMNGCVSDNPGIALYNQVGNKGLSTATVPCHDLPWIPACIAHYHYMNMAALHHNSWFLSASCVMKCDMMQVGTKANGLPVMKCGRSTSQLEGFHRHLLRAVATWTLCPEMMDATMLEFSARWNQKSAIVHQGACDFGHYNFALQDYIVTKEIEIWGTTQFPEYKVTQQVCRRDLHNVA